MAPQPSFQVRGTSVADALPNELLDAIMANLNDRTAEIYDATSGFLVAKGDKSDLSSASLVSRRWRACALPHLFRDMDFTHAIDLAALPTAKLRREVRWLLAGAETKGKHIGQLIEFLETHRTLCAYIKVLSLHLDEASVVLQARLESSRRRRPLPVDVDIRADRLETLVAMLPALRTLAMIDVGVSEPAGTGIKVNALYVSLGKRSRDTLKTLSAFSGVIDLHVITPRASSSLGPPPDGMEDLAVRSFALHKQSSSLPQDDPLLAAPLAILASICASTSPKELRHLLAAFGTKLTTMSCQLVPVPDLDAPAPCAYEAFFLPFSLADCGDYSGQIRRGLPRAIFRKSV